MIEWLILTICSYNGYFVDLFVRQSNKVAIKMYEKFGYTVYRRVIDYYSGSFGDEDAYGKHLMLGFVL